MKKPTTANGWEQSNPVAEFLTKHPASEVDLWRKLTAGVASIASSNGWSKAEVSRRTGIPDGTFSQWFSGKYPGVLANQNQLVSNWLDAIEASQNMAAQMPVSPPFQRTSVGMFERRADWYNRETSKLILGQTTTTDAVSGGHAVSKEHRLVQEDIERSDALDASDTLNAQLIPNIIAFNFGPQEEYPTVHVGRPDEVPLKEFSDAFDKLAKHGLTAEASYLRDRLGIPAPKEGADLVGGRIETVVPPEEKPQQKPLTAKQSLDRLFASAHSREEPDLLDKLTDRLEKDAAAAMDGMIDEVREILSTATDLRDAARKLADLDLSADALAEAMARGMTMAHLIGQAALIDDLKRQS